jgi:hypothetical protein
VSSKAIIAILSKTRPIARMLFSLSISFPSPTLGERSHRGLAARRITSAIAGGFRVHKHNAIVPANSVVICGMPVEAE